MCPSFFLSASLCLCLFLSVCLSVWLCLCLRLISPLFVYLSLSLSVSVCFCLSRLVFVFLSPTRSVSHVSLCWSLFVSVWSASFCVCALACLPAYFPAGGLSPQLLADSHSTWSEVRLTHGTCMWPLISTLRWPIPHTVQHSSSSASSAPSAATRRNKTAGGDIDVGRVRAPSNFAFLSAERTGSSSGRKKSRSPITYT